MKNKYSNTGYWIGDIKGSHFDTNLAVGLLSLFSGDSVVDFGCGICKYVKFLVDNGIDCVGYDGNPNTNEYYNLCYTLDLSQPINLNRKFDWVLSLEVGEHIPIKYEEVFINNIYKHNTKGIVLSWARPKQGGFGHVNCRTQEYIKNKFDQLGYVNKTEIEKHLKSVSKLKWFKNNIMVFLNENNDEYNVSSLSKRHI